MENTPPNALFDWLHWLPECDSTNTWALQHSEQLSHGDCVFTRQQTAGRGQQGRVWYAPAGSLTASFVLDGLLMAQLPGLTLAIGLAVISAIEGLLPHLRGVLQLKWPNDIWANQRKLAGILCEMRSSSCDRPRVIVGVGLNRCVNFAQAGLDIAMIGNPISLHHLSSEVPSEWALLQQLRKYLCQIAGWLEQAGCREAAPSLTLLLPELHYRDALLNQTIQVELGGETLIGTAIGIDAQGRLQLSLPGHPPRCLTSGRVRLLNS